MAILVNENTKVIVQGITGRDGSFHTQQMLMYGTKIVGGVTPGKGGQYVFDLPVFDSMDEAVKTTNADTSIIYVPAPFCVDAIYEAIDAGIKLVVCITEGVPVNDLSKLFNYIQKMDARLIGPNCPGVISPGKSKVGIMPGHIHKPGKIGLISRSGTLTYEVVYALTRKQLGQSTCLGIGGDPVIGTGFIDALDLFNKDNETDAIVIIGEIGGTDEEEAADWIKKNIQKPVVGFIAGKTAPPGKRMGHAGAIISGNMGTADSKINAFINAGIKVADTPSGIADIMVDMLKT